MAIGVDDYQADAALGVLGRELGDSRHVLADERTLDADEEDHQRAVATQRGERLVTTVYVGQSERLDLAANERFAGVVGRERVIAGTDCGFGTSGAGDEVHPDVAWAKLRALVEGAMIASRRLWS